MFSEREGYMRGFFSFILKPHFWNHISMGSRHRWKVDEAIAGSAWVANSAVSSANVAIVTSFGTGKSAV